jgi:hypothetical protein
MHTRHRVQGVSASGTPEGRQSMQLTANRTGSVDVRCDFRRDEFLYSTNSLVDSYPGQISRFTGSLSTLIRVKTYLTNHGLAGAGRETVAISGSCGFSPLISTP